MPFVSATVLDSKHKCAYSERTFKPTEDQVRYEPEVMLIAICMAYIAMRDVLAEVRSARLQKRLLHTVLDIANADGELGGGEAALIACAAECWGIDLFDAFGISTLPQGRPTLTALSLPARTQWLAPGAH